MMYCSFMKKSKDESSTGADIVMGFIVGFVVVVVIIFLDVVKIWMMCNVLF